MGYVLQVQLPLNFCRECYCIIMICNNFKIKKLRPCLQTLKLWHQKIWLNNLFSRHAQNQFTPKNGMKWNRNYPRQLCQFQ